MIENFKQENPLRAIKNQSKCIIIKFILKGKKKNIFDEKMVFKQ